MSIGASRIAVERGRQIVEEGYTSEHDAGHAEQLARAAEAYVFAAEVQLANPDTNPLKAVPEWFPWAAEYWKPSEDPIRNLVKAGALIAAAIDSLEAS